MCPFFNISDKEMIYLGNKSDKEQIFLTPESIMSKYEGWYDPCPHPRHSGFDGLEVAWGQKAFVNPPWGNIRPWVEKALLERGKGCCAYAHRGETDDPSLPRLDLPKRGGRVAAREGALP